MTQMKGTARLGFAAALLALLLAPLAFGFQSAHAQGPDTAQYYGTGLNAGDTVGAWIGGTQCSSTTADADGNWILQVGPGDCVPEDGATVNFSVNGEVAEQTETWSGGGAPSDPAGISLTVEVVEEPTPEPTAEPTAEPTPDAPVMPDDGNAGLVSSESAAPLMALVLGFLAIAGIAGARVSTRRVS